MQSFTDTTTWLRHHGFTAHPFEHLVAEKEADTSPRLDDYFNPFPFFEEVEKPDRTTFLFLKRGSGKSANRVFLEHKCQKSLELEEGAKLAVPYTDFHRLIQKENVSVTDHLEEILKEAVPRLYEFAFKQDKKLRDLSEEHCTELAWFVGKYPHRLNPGFIEKEIKKIVGLSDEQKKEIGLKLIKIPAKFFETFLPGSQLAVDALSGILSSKGEKPEIPKVEHSSLDLMSRFGEIAQQIGIKYIYILVDRVDEYAQIHDYKKTAAILKPLIETIPLLEMPSYAFKFFLPAEIKAEISSHLRSDRFDEYSYTWKADELRKMFESRLAAYCDSSAMPEIDPKTFERLFKENDIRGKDIVSELIQFSNHSPRDLIKLAKTIFDEHTRSAPIDELISKQTYENALSVFAKEQILFRSQTEASVGEIAQLNLTSHSTLKNLLERDLNANAAEELIRKWQENDRFFAPHFSIADIVRFLDKPKSEARELAKKWEDKKLIETHYRIADQSLARYIYAKKESK